MGTLDFLPAVETKTALEYLIRLCGWLVVALDPDWVVIMKLLYFKLYQLHKHITLNSYNCFNWNKMVYDNYWVFQLLLAF